MLIEILEMLIEILASLFVFCAMVFCFFGLGWAVVFQIGVQHRKNQFICRLRNLDGPSF